MPFTFCHPAIILPIYSAKRNWFSLTGLITGSIVPDFEYFLRLQILSRHSHTLPGILYFDLPLAFILAYVFHRFVKNKLIKNLPEYFRSRCWQYKDLDWTSYLKKHWLKVAISILTGTLSHLIWDSFTHETGFIVERIGILNHSVTLANLTTPYFKVAQHLSSSIGFVLITYYITRLPANYKNTPAPSQYYWPFVALSTLTISVINWLKMDMPGTGGIIVITLASAMITLVLIPDIKLDNKSNTLHER